MRGAGVLLLAGLLAAPAGAQILGSDAAACQPGGGPAVLVEVVGLKDRTGDIKLELYPATAVDFTRDDRDLIREGKTFRRVRVPTPRGGDVAVCLRVPQPGRYALLVTHDRDGRNKFNVFQDGAGIPSNARIGMAKPKVAQATIGVGERVQTLAVQMQYLRGLSGFGPVRP